MFLGIIMQRSLIFTILLSLSLIGCQQTTFLNAFNSKEHKASKMELSLEAEAKKFFAEQKYEKAEAIYQQLLAQNPDNLIWLISLADSLRLQNKLSDALPLYSQALERATTHHTPLSETEEIRALEGKGLSLMHQGKFEEAERLFHQILSKDATRWRTINALAVALILTKQPQEAMNYFDIALNLSDHDPSVLNNQGLSYALLEKYSKAIKSIKAAYAKLPATHKQKGKIAMNLALVYGLSGNMKAAEKIAKPYLSERALYNNLGYYALLRKNRVLAKDYLTKALSTTPEHYQRALENLQQLEKKP